MSYSPPRRFASRGDGVGLYIRRDNAVRILPHPPASLVEQMWLSININGIKLLMGTAYKPPWLYLDTLTDALTESLSNKIVLLKNFNINLLHK